MTVKSSQEIRSILDGAKASDIAIEVEDRIVPVESIAAKCEECGKAFDTASKLAKHVRMNHEVRECDICGEEFIGQGVELHKMVHQTRTCEFCGEEKNRNGFATHQKYCPSRIAEENKNKSECEVCGKMIDNRGMKNHLSTHDRDEVLDRDSRIEQAAEILFGSLIPVKMYGKVSKWSEMTNAIMDEME